MSLIAASIPALRSPSLRIGLLTEIALPIVIVELLDVVDAAAAVELELLELLELPHAASNSAVASTAIEHAPVRPSL
jgi:hypothetical protein